MRPLAALLLFVAACGSKGSTGTPDLAHPADFAAPPDLLEPDLAMPDLVVAPDLHKIDLVPAMTGCYGLLMCLQPCGTSDPCIQACYDNTTMGGQDKAGDLFLCLDMACPSSNGGVCDTMAMGYDMMKCQACYTENSQMSGMCFMQLVACIGDP